MRNVLIFLLLLCTTFAWAGDERDSLEYALRTSEGKQKAALLAKLVEAYRWQDTEKMMVYAFQALELSRKMHDKRAEANALNWVGTGYHAQNNFKEARWYFDQSLKLAKAIGDSSAVGNALYSIGQVYNAQVDSRKATAYFFQALRIKEKQNDKLMVSRILNAIGTVYDDLGKIDKALEYYQKALKINEELKDRIGIAMAYNNIGLIYLSKGDYNKALAYQLKSLRMNQSNKDLLGISGSFNNIGDIYFYQKRYSTALTYYTKSLEIDEKQRDSVGLAINNNSIGACHFHLHHYPNALSYYHKAIVFAERMNTKDAMKVAYLGLSDTYEALRNYQQAHNYHKLYVRTKDSILNEESARQIAEMDTQYKTEAKEKEIEILKRQQEIREINEDRQQILILFLIIILGMLVILAILIYSRYSIKKHANTLLKGQNLRIHSQNQALQETNDKLAKSEKELRALNATKDRFFSIISHDLRAPLNSMTGFLQILFMQVDSFTKDEMKDFASKMDKSVRNLVDMLDNLLHWSRSQTNTIEFQPEVVPLVELIHKTIELLKDTANRKEIHLYADVATHLQAYADPNMLSLIVRNLIFNAVKFTRPGGSIRVSARLLTSELLEIAVADTGVGMSEEEMAKLFKVDALHTTKGTANEPGTGLGLLLCSEFVQKQGGEIRVESQLKKGTVFRFTLPAIQKEAFVSPN